MKLLSIGNSFSQDAHKWLSQIARSCGDDLTVVNLFIGGCSLETHWNNFLSAAPNYDLEINGEFSSKISLPAALPLEKWDVITFQQASGYSGETDSYFPFLTNLHREISQLCPGAVFYIHKTWAYECDSSHPHFIKYGSNQKQMYLALSDAYRTAASSINCDTIPVGDIVQQLRENCAPFNYQNGGLSLNRDGFHLSLLYGRYAAALTWYKKLFGKNVSELSFVPETDADKAAPSLLKQINLCVESFFAQ